MEYFLKKYKSFELAKLLIFIADDVILHLILMKQQFIFFKILLLKSNLKQKIN